MEDKLRKEISKNYQGNWINMENNEVIKLTIREDEVILLKEKEGKEFLKETFSGTADWFDNFLCFSGKGRMYNITYADKDYLIFGKQRISILGDYEWKIEFKRVG